MFFKRTLQRYGQTPEPVTPYQKAAQLWDERIGSARVSQALQDYAAVYRATYGQAEAVAELIPFMLEAFLDGDRGFVKARKEGIEAPLPEAFPAPRPRRSRRAGEAAVPSITSAEE